jgi:hypothetical protein
MARTCINLSDPATLHTIYHHRLPHGGLPELLYWQLARQVRVTPRSFGELNGCHHLRQIHVINESGESFYTINSFGGLICFFCIMSHASIRHFPICAYVARATRKRNLTGRRPTLDVAEAGSTRSRRLLRGMHVACRMQTVQKGFRWNTWTGSSVLFLLIYSINFLPHYDGWRRLPSSINFAYVARTRRTIGFNSTSHAPNAVTPWRWRLGGKLRKSSTSVTARNRVLHDQGPTKGSDSTESETSPMSCAHDQESNRSGIDPDRLISFIADHQLRHDGNETTLGGLLSQTRRRSTLNS